MYQHSSQHYFPIMLGPNPATGMCNSSFTFFEKSNSELQHSLHFFFRYEKQCIQHAAMFPFYSMKNTSQPTPSSIPEVLNAPK